MSVELRGFDDLQNDMLNMAAALENGPGVNKALKAGAKPIEEQMLHNASTDPKIITGELIGSIRTGNIKGGARGKHAGGGGSSDAADARLTLPDYINSTYNALMKSGWRMTDIDDMDILGFLKLRAWDAGQERMKSAPKRAYIDQVWKSLKP